MAGSEMRTRRLNRELTQLQENAIAGITVNEDTMSSNLDT